MVLSYRKYDPGGSSRIRILTFYAFRIPDPGVKKAQDPGSGSATLLPMRTYPVLAFLFLLLSEARLVGTSTKSVSWSSCSGEEDAAGLRCCCCCACCSLVSIWVAAARPPPCYTQFIYGLFYLRPVFLAGSEQQIICKHF